MVRSTSTSSSEWRHCLPRMGDCVSWELSPWRYGKELRIRQGGPSLESVLPEGFQARLVGTETGTPGEAIVQLNPLTVTDVIWYLYRVEPVPT